MPKITEMTMQEIIEKARKKGFKGSWSKKNHYSWESSEEHDAIVFLQNNDPELFEEKF